MGGEKTHQVGTTFFLPSFLGVLAAVAAGAAVAGVFFTFAVGLAGLSNVDTPPAAPAVESTVPGGLSVVDLVVFVTATVVVPDAATVATGTAVSAAVIAAVVAAVEHSFNLSIPSNSTGNGPLGTTG